MSSASACIGRVGGVAVALGIGAWGIGAGVFGVGTAWAAPDTGSSDTGSSNTGPEARSAKGAARGPTAPTPARRELGRELGKARPAAADSVSSVSQVSVSVAPAKASVDNGIFGALGALIGNLTPAMRPTQSGQSASGQIKGSVNTVDDDSEKLKYTVTTGPTHGSVSIADDGSFTYNPDAQFARIGTVDTFSVTVSDEVDGFHIHGIAGLLNLLSFGLIGSSGHNSSATVSVLVTPWVPNNAPVGDAFANAPDLITGVVTGRVSGTDVDGDHLTFSGSTTTAKGVVAVSDDGVFSYTPTSTARHSAASETASVGDRTDTFAVTMIDGFGASVAVPVIVTIGASNAKPNAAVDVIGSPEASGVVKGRVLGSDVDGDTVVFGGSTTTAKGTVVVAADGSFTYTPSASSRHAASSSSAAVGDSTDVFVITVGDRHGGTVAVPVSVSITPVNTNPTAGQSVIGIANVANGRVSGRVVVTDADGDVLTYGGSTVTAKGALVVSADGSFVYTPTDDARHAAASLSATAGEQVDVISVHVTDGHGGSVSVPISIPIAAVNAAPLTSASAIENPSTAGIVSGRAAASDPDGDALTYSGSTTTAKGAVVVHADGTFVYTPTAAARHASAAVGAGNTDKTDTFTISVADGHGGVSTIPVTVAISADNATLVVSASRTNAANGIGVVTGSVTASDPDGDLLGFSGMTTDKGRVVVNSDGSFTYTPTASARHAASEVTADAGDRTDSFVITITDGHGATVSVPFTVTITPANAAPVAGPTVIEDPSGTATVVGRVVATDSDGDTITFTGSATTAKGSVVVSPDGSFSYTPNPAAVHAAASATAPASAKTDRFVITGTDGHGATVAVAVDVVIRPANNAPVVSSSTPGTPNASTGVVSGVVIAADPDGDSLTYSGSTTTARGSVVVNSVGTYTYTPTWAARHAASVSGATVATTTDSFTVSVSDGHGAVVPVTIAVTIAPANAAPGGGTSSVTATNTATGVVTGRASAVDNDGDALSYSGSTSTSKGAVVVNSDGTFSYTPTIAARHAASATTSTAGQRADNFVITADDGHGGVVNIAVSVPISPSNVGPVVVSTSAGVPSASTGVVAGRVALSDADGDALTYSGVSPAKGSLVVNSDGTFTFTPTVGARHAASAVDATAADTTEVVSIVVTDGHGGAVTVPVTVSIGSSNTGPLAGSSVVNQPDSSGAVTGFVTATDADNDSLTFGGSGSTPKGSVVVGSDGTFTYLPSASARDAAAALGATAAQRMDTFVITVNDGHGGTVNIPITAAVAPANTTPTSVNVTVSSPNGATGLVSGRVTVNGAIGDSLNYSATSASKGTVVVNSDGTFTYSPTADARHSAAAIGAVAGASSDAFSIVVTDGEGVSLTVPVSVAISPSNTAPVVGTAVMDSPDRLGVIRGTIVATDADSDVLTYAGSASTPKGAVLVASDGSFTYTPTAAARDAAAASGSTEADRTDSFVVTVADGHGATVDVTVSVGVTPTPPAVTFNFSYGSGSQYWSQNARDALQAAADILSSYIIVSAPVTLTYNVTGINTPGNNTLATAYVYYSSSGAGFYDGVVQKKILTGVDANGSAADGLVVWNFAYPYAYGDSEAIPNNSYDFTSVAMHELMHTLGILSAMEGPTNANTNWLAYDRFLVTADGARVVNDNYAINSAYLANFTGSNGGIYFGGPNAVAAYGGPVPLYTPSTWSSGASLSHLDEGNVGGDDQIMNAWLYYGPAPREVGAVELGILKDLGYTIVSDSSGGGSGSAVAAFGILGFGFLRRRRRKT